MSSYQWQTFHRSFIGNGSIPLNQDTLKLYTLPVGSTIRRTLLHMQLSSTLYATTAAGQPLDYPATVIAAAGLWLGDLTTPAPNSPPVLDDANTADWLLWDTLQGRTDMDALAASGIFRQTWSTPSAGLDVQTRRNAVPGNSNDLWLGWQISDPYAVINASTGSYTDYLSGWFSIRMLIYTP